MKKKVNTKKKVSTKPKSKPLKQADVICRAYPELRFRINNWQGRFFPMVQVSFISWLYIFHDVIHDEYKVGNSHSGCNTREEALKIIDGFKARKIAYENQDNCEYL